MKRLLSNDTVWCGFDDWSDIQTQYSSNEPEPDEVICAFYDHSGYEGSSDVVYRNGNKYYWVNGGHCSCYGLEDQWKPVEYKSKNELIAVLEKGYAPYMKEILKALNG